MSFVADRTRKRGGAVEVEMQKVRFEQDGELGIVTLADPPLNLVGPGVVDDFEHALDLAEEASVRALLLRAEGEHFTAGAHVAEMFQNVSEADARVRVQRLVSVMQRIERLPYPTVAATQGLCIAAGLELISAVDMVVAAESAQFGFPEPLIGLAPPAGGPHRLAARAGMGRAIEAILTAGFYDAQTMREWGVVNRVVPDAELEERSLKLARRLATGATRAFAVAKELLRTARDEGGAAADARCPELCPPLFETEDMRVGIESLLEKGPGHAQFVGR